MQPLPSFTSLTPSINSFTPPQPPPPTKFPSTQQQIPQPQYTYAYHPSQNPLLAQYQNIPQYSAYLASPPSYSTYQSPSSFVCLPNNNRVIFNKKPTNFNLSAQNSSIKSISNLNSHNQTIINPTSNISGNNSNGNKQSDDLRSSIQIFVKTLESSYKNKKNQTDNSSSGTDNSDADYGAQQISTLSSRFAIKRRRLYDVINVFEAIGCCEKSGLDAVRWVGKENIIVNLRSLKIQRGVHDRRKHLDDLFPVPCCVGISNLSISFLLLFFALQQDRVDLRYASQFFSRTTARYKTTLCKLYQICYILGSIGVTSRTAQVCEVILNKPYFDEEVLPPLDDFDHDEKRNSNDKDDPNSLYKHRKRGHNLTTTTKQTTSKSPPVLKLIDMSINSLLNHKEDDINDNQYIYDRRKELEDCYSEFIKKNDETRSIDTAAAFV